MSRAAPSPAAMDTGAQIIIGIAVVAIGAVTLGAGVWMEEEAAFRQVNELLAAPDAHRDGTFTLVGSPLVTTRDGGPNETTRVVMWRDAGGVRQSSHSLRVVVDPNDGTSRWTFRNETRAVGGPSAQAFEPIVAEWTIDGPHVVFLIRGWAASGEATPEVWGVYRDVPPEPLEPKPSQFVGRLLDALPAERALADGPLVWSVESYTIGCSSKFLPPEATAEVTNGAQ